MWWIIIAILLVIGLLCILRSRYECRTLTVTHYRIASPKVGSGFEGFRMAVLADLHENTFGERNSKLVEAIEREKPDIILIAGDMIIAKEWKQKDFSALRDLLWQLRSFPVFYGNGNHEQRMEEEKQRYPGWEEEFQQILNRCGVHHLKNESVVIQRGNDRIRLSEIDIDKEYYLKGSPVEMEDGYLEKKLGPCPGTEFQILLAHSPLYLEQYEKWGADLTFSGHFHGGTIRLPGIGGVMSPQLQFFTKRDKGMLNIGHTHCIISGGLGTHTINVRLNNLPELLIVDLEAEPKAVGGNG